ncbi:aspartate/glutamate racemase family protein [Paracoccus sp. 1_MG-2023]|uniref:aspartate/glutamate racemase family protein n=1 Tax=unclassified Paracoccus (in: a-proteobacteria) TaxID=2688777 RepID=UPI001C08784D|nr:MULTISPECIES: aspartate/glutamate racemase family protein [unclassified Paracoccus (in: a-proteobacteria)]MBU2958295.1 hypothetical protein [Paracoccus sp. C2R09]MDO6668422.1 aspartate/glutamate racemase family protein [Paracoccus sp. 1_MG-2023]
MPKVALINPNSNPDTTLRMVALARTAVPGLLIKGHTATRSPRMIVTAHHLKAAAAEVEEIGARLTGIDGVIVSAYGDPGADALASRLTVPVTGLAKASFVAAARHGRFGVATTTPDLAAAIDARAAALGHGDRFVGTFVAGDADPLALMSDPDRLVATLARAVRMAMDAGAQAVCIGGGPLAGLGRMIGEGVPLIDPVTAAAIDMQAQIDARPH